MAKPPHTGSEIGVFYLMCWRRNYPHARGTRPRVDDIPLLLEQMQRMGLPTLLDTHFPTHGNWTGLSLGWVSTIWLSSILSRGDHRLVHVEPWVAKRLWTLVVLGRSIHTDNGMVS
jgi:transposase